MLAKRVSGGHGGAQTPPNHPGRRKPITKTQQFQRKLWTLAKRDKGRRFHALYDRVHRWDVLEESWGRVKRNGGSGGVDGKTIQGIESLGVEAFLKGIERDLKEGTYQPSPVRRVMIPKPVGRKVRDRVVQMATKLVIEPIFEADFQECSFGFRPKRSALGALERIRVTANSGRNVVMDADIKDYF